MTEVRRAWEPTEEQIKEALERVRGEHLSIPSSEWELCLVSVGVKLCQKTLLEWLSVKGRTGISKFLLEWN